MIKDGFIFDPSLVFYLPLYELDGDSFMSKDAYGHLATVTGALWRPDGRLFDGTDDLINCGDSLNLAPTTSVALEVWMKTGTSQSTSLLRRGDLASTAEEYMVYITNTAVAFYMRDSLGAQDYLYGTFSCEDNVWHHLVGLFDGDYIRIYADGNEIGSKDTVLTNIGAAVGRIVHLGRYDTVYYTGLIGEARIYNRGLTPLEIQRNYLQTKWRYQ